jgi:hypothetical protein
MRRLEAEQIQDLLHRDLSAKSVEVDPGHGWFFRLAGIVG